MHQRDGTDSRSFEQAIQDNAERLRAGFHWDGDDGAARWRFMFEQYVRYGRLPAPTYLEFGQYGPQLQRYLEHFPRDRLAVVLFESLRRDTEQVVRRIWEFLEIQPGIVRRLNLEPRNMANSSKRQPNLPVDLKEWLRAIITTAISWWRSCWESMSAPGAGTVDLVRLADTEGGDTRAYLASRSHRAPGPLRVRDPATRPWPRCPATCGRGLQCPRG